MNLQLQQYRQQQIRHEVEQASPVQLILLLYDRTLNLLQQALSALQAGEMARKGEAILKALDIICELKAVLNSEEGGEIAAQLAGLYTFMLQQLTLANLGNDAGKIKLVVKLVEELREGWRGVTALVQQGEVMAPDH